MTEQLVPQPARISPKAAMLLAYLAGHIGAANGVTVAQIAIWLNWRPREVRHLVTELREHGHALCGHPKTGYYIAASADELEVTCGFLTRRALHALRLVALLRRMPMQDLLGQLKLST